MARMIHSSKAAKAVVHMIRMEGPIQRGRGSASISFRRFEKALTKAFNPKKSWFGAEKKPAFVALVVNSNGGSPAQSSLIFERVRQLRQASGVPVVTFVEDAALSGGMYLAAAGDEIVVNGASMLGSVGVILPHTHVDKLLQRWDVHADVVQRGSQKTLLSPLKPPKEEDLARARALLDSLYQQFWSDVVSARGGKLFRGDGRAVTDLKDPLVAEAEVYVGQAAVDVGLADKVGTFHREALVKTHVDNEKELKVVDFTPGSGWEAWGNWAGASGGGGVSASMASGIADAAEGVVTRALQNVIHEAGVSGALGAMPQAAAGAPMSGAR